MLTLQADNQVSWYSGVFIYLFLKKNSQVFSRIARLSAFKSILWGQELVGQKWNWSSNLTPKVDASLFNYYVPNISSTAKNIAYV